MVKGFSEGVRDFVAIAVVGPDDLADCPPCGACRQVLHEAAPELLVVMPRGDGGRDERPPRWRSCFPAPSGERLAETAARRR